MSAVNYVLDRRVETWNTKGDGACDRITLSRAQVVHLFKKSNTRGGSFQLKKVNHVAGATLVYDGGQNELVITLEVVEGEPNDKDAAPARGICG